jgi:cell division septation protein DedD
MTHDTDDGFHEIHLSGKQLVFLVMTAAVTLVFTFLLGVMVGRQAGEREPGTAFAAGPPPDTETLPHTGEDVEPPTPAELAEELTYHRRLQGETAAPPAKSRPGPAEPQPEPSRSQPEPPSPPESEEPPPAVAAAPRSAEAPSRAASTVPSDVPTTGRPGQFVVQVFASRDLEPAASLVRRLARNGHPAFLVAPEPGATLPMYRVQVGRYTDRRDADEASRRIEKEVQIKPWISSR